MGRGSSRGRDVVGSRALSSARCCGIHGSVLRSTCGSKQYPTVLLRQVEEQESYQPHPWKVQLSTHLLLINSCLNVHPFPISTTAAKFHMTEIAQIFQTERQPFFFFFLPSLFFFFTTYVNGLRKRKWSKQGMKMHLQCQNVALQK